jgi:hypothetical protein
MIRTQIQLDEHSYAMLRETALHRHRSMAACIRTAIEQFLRDADSGTDDLSDIAGRFRPLPMDDVKGHDRQWAEAVMNKRSAS